MSNSAKLNVILIGNPGVGKSTFLNGLMGSLRFKSGVKLGRGLTSVCQIEQDASGNRYIDTPGLSDVSLRKQAAEEINNALKMGGIFKIFFVITLEEGRIRPDDKTTMKLVLDAAPIGSNYSIIINKLHPTIVEAFCNKKEAEEFFALLNEGLPGTTFIHLSRLDQELSAQNDKLSELSTGFYNFVCNAPMLEIKPTEVKAIKEGNFDQINAELSKVIDELVNDNKKMREAIEKNMAKMDKMNKAHKQELERLREASDARVDLMMENHQAALKEASSRLKEVEERRAQERAQEMARLDEQTRKKKEKEEEKRKEKEAAEKARLEQANSGCLIM